MRKYTEESGYLANSAAVFAGLTALIGGLGLLGWIAGIRVLASINLSYIPIAPDSAISLIIIAIIVLVSSRPKTPARLILPFKIASAIIAIYGILKFIEYFVHADLTFANILFPIEEWIEGAPVKRMSPVTGILLFFSASASYIHLRDSAKSRYSDVISLLGGIVFILSAIPTIGYLFGTPLLYGSSIIPIAAPTSVAFVLLGLSLMLVAGPDSVLLGHFFGSSVKSILLRAFAPLAIFAVLAQGLLNEWLSNHYEYNHAILAATISLFFAFLAAIVVARISHVVGKLVEQAEDARRKNEEMLKMRNEFIEAILKNVHLGVAVHDTITSQTIYMNPAFEHAYGIKADEITDVGKFFEKVYTNDDYRQKLLDLIMPGMASGDPAKMKWDDIAVPEPSENARYVSATNIPLLSQNLMISTVLDVTDRKRAEDNLKASEERFRSLFENATIGIYRTGPDSRNLLVNKAMLRIMGFDSLEELSRRMAPNRGYVNAADAEEFLRRMDADGEIIGFESAWVRKDGSPVHVRESARAVRDSAGNLLYFEGTVEDITERKRAEEALRHSEEQFRTLFENNLAGVYRSDMRGNILECNDAFVKMFGYESKSELQKVNASSFYPVGSDRTLFTSELKEKKKLSNYEFKLQRKDHSTIWISEHVILISNPITGEDEAQGTIVDISESKRVSEALAHSEERYRKLSSMATEGVFIHLDGLIVEANQAAANLFGFKSPLDLIGKKGPDVIHFTPESQQRVAHHIKNKTDDVYEVEILRPDAPSIIAEAHGKDIIWQGSNARLSYIRDITDRKRAEAELRDSEERFRAIFDSALDGLFVRPVIDALQTPFTFINPAASEMLGYSIEELLQMTPADIELDNSETTITERVATILTKGSHQFETVFHRKDGSTFPVDINLHVFNLRGQQMIVAIVRDISARKSLEDQLRQAQKMEAIGRLAGGVAHDFNNLLTVITGHSELMMYGLKDKDPLKDDVQEIINAADRATSLTRQLLAFSRKQPLAPKVINLNASIQNMEKMLNRLIGEDISLVTISAPSLWKVKVDPAQIEQVIINLAVNARDAMPDGGNLTIETSNVYLDEEYIKLHPEVTTGHYVMLAVSDTGFGMNNEIKSRIFDPFFTTKPIGKGTGLGLSTVYGIVKQSNGSINVYSEIGKGTVFKIYLPIIQSEEIDIVSNTIANIDKLKGSESILVVEDEDAVRKVAVKFLEAYGYKVTSASNGNEAIELYLADKLKFDLLLTDVIMPNMKGNELAAILRNHIPDLKVIFMSGYTANAVVHNGIIDPGTPYLAKPFSPIELAKKVRELLDSPRQI